MKRITKMLALGTLAVGVQQASAVPLLPGTQVGLVPGVAVGAELASLSSDFSNELYSGTVTSWVYDSPGGLTFVYQVLLNANVPGNVVEDISRLTTFGWAGFLTDVSQEVVIGNQPGATADRDGNLLDPTSGETVGFNFPATGDTFLEGETSYRLVVVSNAEDYREGLGAIINGRSSNLDVLVPDIFESVPDGGTTAVLLGLGVLGLAGFRRKIS